MSLNLLMLMSLAASIATALQWATFLALSGWSIYALLATRTWPDADVSDIWIGWYLLIGSAISWLAGLALIAEIRDRAGRILLRPTDWMD